MASMYVQVIVSYDIADTKARHKLFNELKDLGLKPIQKSVFWGYLLPSEKGIIPILFDKYCQIETDRAFMVNAVLDQCLEYAFGYDEEDFKHPESFVVL